MCDTRAFCLSKFVSTKQNEGAERVGLVLFAFVVEFSAPSLNCSPSATTYVAHVSRVDYFIVHAREP